MKNTDLPNIHPGQILKEEFLKPLGMTQYHLSQKSGIPESLLSEICQQRRGITIETALALGGTLKTTSVFWLNLQNAFDLEEARRNPEKTNKSYKIICYAPDGRVLAHLDSDGTLTIHHDHFTDEEDFNIGEIIDTLDRWSVRRNITHLSKRGLNQKTVIQISAIQKAKPGKILFDFEPAAKI